MSPPDAGGALSFPHPAPPPDGTLLEVAPGVRWLRMPLPFVLNHINLWLIEDGAGWAIVDTGIQGDGIKEVWRRILADDLGGRPITRVIVTHHHPDHVGLAGWLVERSSAELSCGTIMRIALNSASTGPLPFDVTVLSSPCTSSVRIARCGPLEPQYTSTSLTWIAS